MTAILPFLVPVLMLAADGFLFFTLHKQQKVRENRPDLSFGEFMKTPNMKILAFSMVSGALLVGVVLYALFIGF